jgi:hypothetical protein
MTRSQAYQSLHRVSGEFRATRFALIEVLRATNENLGFLQAATREQIGESELRRASANIEVTFILRLFGEFEAILREFWATLRPTAPDMKPLMDAIAARRSMAPTDLAAAHDVRALRNAIIHQNVRVFTLTFAHCTPLLGRYLRWLPETW